MNLYRDNRLAFTFLTSELKDRIAVNYFLREKNKIHRLGYRQLHTDRKQLMNALYYLKIQIFF